MLLLHCKPFVWSTASQRQSNILQQTVRLQLPRAQLGRPVASMDPMEPESIAAAQQSLAPPAMPQKAMLPPASKASMPPPSAETSAKPSATQVQVSQPKAAGASLQVVLLIALSQVFELIDLPACRQHPTSSNEGCCICSWISCSLDTGTAGTGHPRSCLAGTSELAEVGCREVPNGPSLAGRH